MFCLTELIFRSFFIVLFDGTDITDLFSVLSWLIFCLIVWKRYLRSTWDTPEPRGEYVFFVTSLLGIHRLRSRGAVRYTRTSVVT